MAQAKIETRKQLSVMECEAILKVHDPDFLEYWNKHATAFSNLSVSNYARHLVNKSRKGD